MTDYFNARSLCHPPVNRAAFSDRTAWLMAELSRLAYERLPAEQSITEHIANLKKAIAAGQYESELQALIACATGRSKNTGESAVPDILHEGGFTFLDSFSVDGTEAFLAKLEGADCGSSLLVLAFRGTQPEIRDIVTDIKANLVPAPFGGRVHGGFLTAFKKVEKQIARALEEHKDSGPLYITGHSLGGALALLATRYLGSDSTGATYTFGAPRMADDYFYTQIKTPIYRVVNAADGVARIPFGPSLNLLIAAIRIIPVNYMFNLSELIRKHLGGYTHEGSLIFLSDCANEPDDKGIPFKELTVKASPDYFWRSWHVIKRLATTRLRAAITDHSISIYCQKLLANALRREHVGKHPDAP